jgi:cytochrome P450
VVDFDHNSPEHSLDPRASYAALRTKAPVAWTEAHGGYWVLSDYDAVFEAARNHEVFSSARSDHGGRGLANVIPKAPVRLHIPVELDPPGHRSYRKILNPVTSPAAVEKLKPMIAKWTTWFIDQVIEEGECDFASVIGVPAVVTLDWLGLDVDDWRHYSRALHSVLADRPGSEAHTRAVEVDIPWMEAQITEAISQRRKKPREDLITHLLAQEVDGAPITDNAAYSLIELLISGGVGTTASLVSQTLVHLHLNPEQREKLRDNPGLLERAVEEFLRVFSPTQALARTVAEDIEFRGCPMEAGDRVLLAWSSANRDGKYFESPDEVDLERWPNRHTAFGMGIHRCAGAHVGRAIARELLGQIIERMPDYEIDMASVQAYHHQGVNAGFMRIPATFTPGVRRGPASSEARQHPIAE